MEKVTQVLNEAREQIAACSDPQALDALRVRYLGKKGEITALLKTLGGLAPEDRRAYGQAVNAAKQEVTELIGARREALEAEQLAARLESERVDVTLPGRGEHRGGLHPVTRAMQRIVGIFAHLGFEVATGPEVEDDYHNFESLNFPAHHPARAMHDTFYFGDGRLLRTHTSPVQIREMQKQGAPIRIIAGIASAVANASAC